MIFDKDAKTTQWRKDILFFFFFLNLFNLFIYGCIGSLLLHMGFLWSLCSFRGYSLLRWAGFSLRWLLLLRSTGSRCAGLVVPWHVGSFRTKARSHVPCIGRWILNHWATREVPGYSFQQMVLGKQDMHMQENEVRSLFYTVYKNELKMD